MQVPLCRLWRCQRNDVIVQCNQARAMPDTEYRHSPRLQGCVHLRHAMSMPGSGNIRTGLLVLDLVLVEATGDSIGLLWIHCLASLRINAQPYDTVRSPIVATPIVNCEVWRERARADLFLCCNVQTRSALVQHCQRHRWRVIAEAAAQTTSD